MDRSSREDTAGSDRQGTYRPGQDRQDKSPRWQGRLAVPGRNRTVILAMADASLYARLAAQLRQMRWEVRITGSAAAMFALVEQQVPAALLLDAWLPDLEVSECIRDLSEQFPEIEILRLDGMEILAPIASTEKGVPRTAGPRRAELLHVVRTVQQALEAEAGRDVPRRLSVTTKASVTTTAADSRGLSEEEGEAAYLALNTADQSIEQPVEPSGGRPAPLLPEFVGSDARILEVCRRVGLVAHRKTTVLVHGPSGTGKELVARALHRLSDRAQQRFVAINCAAIPEALIEAELFGHARGAFTGAVQGRVGRIESAAGGTLFLDEIGELPLALQGKLLRFLECGELQRVGENEVIRLDTRVVAATHRRLGAMVAAGSFRLDLLHRLSVFLIETPPLAGRKHDIDALAALALRKLAQEERLQPGSGGQWGDVRLDGRPRRAEKHLTAGARALLYAHDWPGNVRELEHTLERGWILAGDTSVIDESCIDFGQALL